MRPLTLYPAIDLKGGACVRLRRGDMDQATVYGENPGAQARAWQEAGCDWLHVVDLDGAFAGRSVNTAAVRAILVAARVPVQLGGGIRELASIEAWLAEGVRRVILGSVAAKDPDAGAGGLPSFPRAGSRSGSTRGTGSSQPRAGPRPHRSRSRLWPCSSRMPARPRSSSPISGGTGCSVASISTRRQLWRGR